MQKHYLWFSTVLVLVIIFGTMYGVVQHAQRMAANMPQIQLAQDAAAALDHNTAPDGVVRTWLI